MCNTLRLADAEWQRVGASRPFSRLDTAHWSTLHTLDCVCRRHELLANRSAQGTPHNSKKGPSGVFVRTFSRFGGSLRYSA